MSWCTPDWSILSCCKRVYTTHWILVATNLWNLSILADSVMCSLVAVVCSLAGKLSPEQSTHTVESIICVFIQFCAHSFHLTPLPQYHSLNWIGAWLHTSLLKSGRVWQKSRPVFWFRLSYLLAEAIAVLFLLISYRCISPSWQYFASKCLNFSVV